MGQLSLPLATINQEPDTRQGSYRDRLFHLLRENLDFQGQYSAFATHNLHPFPAKFPPQLPRIFINRLTEPGDTVLDPMMGSGTTVLEAYLAERQAIGFDIDPLALLLARVKLTPIALDEVENLGRQVLRQARELSMREDVFNEKMAERFDTRSRAFIDYWFPVASQRELLALIYSIETIQDQAISAFLKLCFSATVITKSAGVSMARDLAHTRPHRVKEMTWRSPLQLFEKRLAQNLSAMANVGWTTSPIRLEFGDAQALPLANESVDLIVTSPPYASNAIDYMRAHKFSLIWLGYPIDDLSERRKGYVGGEALDKVIFEPLPSYTAQIVSEVAEKDGRKSLILHRYYSEMTRVLKEYRRVLKSGKAAILVVGTSTMRGAETQVHYCLADIGRSLDFDVVDIGIRRIDRNRRMLPARNGGKNGSQIEERMHEEYIIGFYKP